MTGWGQDGPLARAAGHDINYIALTGALHATGRAGQPPSVPLNLLGDYAGGALYLAFGLLAGIIEARGSGKGQVVDAAIVDGTAHLLTSFHGLLAMGAFREERGTNIVDSGAYFYDVYECADGEWVSVGPIEGRFHDALLAALGIDPAAIGAQMNPEAWPRGKALLAERFRTRTRAQWCELLEGTDACFAPVLRLSEAPDHPHLRARGTYVEVDGVVQPAAAPRFSRTPAATPAAPRAATPDAAEAALAGWLDPAEIARLRADGTLG
jgi:crotonobetainyl-CoA:carnitine CoA-transferase CaiB-like acyl-CoA transferase